MGVSLVETLLTPKELAERWRLDAVCGNPVAYIHRLTQQKKIPPGVAVKVGGYYRYRLQGIEDFERNGGLFAAEEQSWLLTESQVVRGFDSRYSTLKPMTRTSVSRQTVSQLTRRDIFDYLSLEGIAWYGRLEEVAFLERVWDLKSLPSTDGRFKDAAGDIWQHRVNNPWDWEDDWVFMDSRFDLMHGSDGKFLQFLCEMVNPVVRSDSDEVEQLVVFFNEKLRNDGWALSATDQMSGRPIFTAHRTKGAKQPSSALRIPEYQRLRDPRVFEEHLRRIEAGLAADPAAAIASSKEMVESACKIILDDYEVSYRNGDDLLTLYKKAALALKLNAESVPDNKKGSQAAQGILRSLVATVQRLAELRNELGLGHGRSRASQALTRHARLAFNSGASVAEFLLDTWHDRRGDMP